MTSYAILNIIIITINGWSVYRLILTVRSSSGSVGIAGLVPTNNLSSSMLSSATSEVSAGARDIVRLLILSARRLYPPPPRASLSPPMRLTSAGEAVGVTSATVVLALGWAGGLGVRVVTLPFFAGMTIEPLTVGRLGLGLGESDSFLERGETGVTGLAYTLTAVAVAVFDDVFAAVVAEGVLLGSGDVTVLRVDRLLPWKVVVEAVF